MGITRGVGATLGGKSINPNFSSERRAPIPLYSILLYITVTFSQFFYKSLFIDV